MYALEPGERDKKGHGRRMREREGENKVEYGEWVLIWKHCKRLIRFVFYTHFF